MKENGWFLTQSEPVCSITSSSNWKEIGEVFSKSGQKVFDFSFGCVFLTWAFFFIGKKNTRKLISVAKHFPLRDDIFCREHKKYVGILRKIVYRTKGWSNIFQIFLRQKGMITWDALFARCLSKNEMLLFLSVRDFLEQNCGPKLACLLKGKHINHITPLWIIKGYVGWIHPQISEGQLHSSGWEFNFVWSQNIKWSH